MQPPLSRRTTGCRKLRVQLLSQCFRFVASQFRRYVRAFSIGSFAFRPSTKSFVSMQRARAKRRWNWSDVSEIFFDENREIFFNTIDSGKWSGREVGSKLNDHFFLEDFFWRIFEEKNWGNFLDSSYRFSSNLTTWIVFGRTPKREYFLERENSISTTVAEFQITVHRASNGREMLNRFESNRVEILFSWKRVRERSKKNRSNFQRYLAIACDGRGIFVGPNRKEAEDYWSKFEKHAFQGGVYRLIARVDDREKSERANEARDKIKLEQCLPWRFSVYRILPSHFDDHARLSFIREIIYLTLWLYNFTPDSRFNAFQTL